ncbi:uncharacterized protein I303_104034 [Kwoniella dejecticola CBS 10117]|uniref:RFX-type winged-helix domain-containing protein n=1 Tax=Kwoniella dejecticola CBS 10117 TaxID=1296121 RepID=A0A1A6A8D9_9TREE|nr:uncharacterized protein I303_04053 [Kwoniella dejecticola CBS 10117]OBR86329.1 hypothetical protein I303_04053 [Kwoniella dejecticola CBS 10117]
MSRVFPPVATSSRQIAPLPHHQPQPQHQYQAQLAQGQSQQSNSSRWTPYAPNIIELYPGPKNRLFLSLRSGIGEEVDYALPKLVVASFNEIDKFKLETWVDSVSALKEWPEKWIEGLELEVASQELRKSRRQSSSQSKLLRQQDTNGATDDDIQAPRELALSVVPEWTLPQSTIDRATNSLLVLRNASFTNTNAKIICRTSFLEFLIRFFSLPTSYLLEVSLRTPEPIHHILNILQSIFPFLVPNHANDPRIQRIFNVVLPELLIHTRDQAMIQNILPLLISNLSISNNHNLFPYSTLQELISHLLNLIVLRPTSPPVILDLSLDLLISLTQNTNYCKQILLSPEFSAHLKSLLALLDYDARQTQATWENPQHLTGKVIRNPAGEFVRNENSQKRRKLQRELNQRQMEIYGGPGVRVEVGEKAPALSKQIQERLYAMREPTRSIAWMHEIFIYSSTSQLLQVTFWHAYRDFFQNPSTIDPLLSASEVIKNVTVAFPGAMAKVWTDEMGGQKFVIAGMGFRKGSDDQERFTCLWQNCPSPHSPTDPKSLLAHIQATHLTTSQPPLRCQWADCTQMPFTLSHLLTHLPSSHPTPVPEVITSHPSTPDVQISQSSVTSRLVPPLARPFKLHFAATTTPTESTQGQGRIPVGTALLTCLILRNLAKTLKAELNLLDVDLIREKESQKKKNALEERFGLPIPENVLKEEEKEEQDELNDKLRNQFNQQDEIQNRERLNKARNAFVSAQERLREVVEQNISGLAGYLGESLGW